MKLFTRFTVLVALLLLAAYPVAAQTVNADLLGTVTSDGKPLPGVTVTISSPNLQGTKTTVTGDNGAYRFGALPPGDYTVKFELAGLQTVTKRTTLQLAQTSRADADLKVEGVSEAITVTASAPSVLETPSVSTNLSAELVDKLPAGRTVLATALLAPGVNDNTQSASQLSISGGPGYDNLIMVNGVVITENVRAQAMDLFVEDAIQETTVLSGAVSAEYGRFTGGVVNTLTKSGGNEFTASFRDSLTNPRWTSLTPIETVKPASKNNQVFEATLGGFILKDRLWFFTDGRKAKTDVARLTRKTLFPYDTATDEKRYEGKLTGQITQKHSVWASYLKNDATQTNGRFTSAIYDLASLTDRKDPQSLLSAHYSGIITPSFLVEGQYSRRRWSIVGSGSKYTDLIQGTLMRNSADGNARFNSPTFCGVCDTERRNNDGWQAKASYFLNTQSLGNHNLVGGYEDFANHRYANNFQSGSNFRVNVSDIIYTDAAKTTPLLINGSPVPVILPNSSRTYIRWTPIFVGAAENNLETKSVFLNDRWDLNSHWTFNAGLRYDRNNSVTGNGVTTSNDSQLSPRLSAIWDVSGNGKHRITAGFNRYVSALSEGPTTAGESTGAPGTIDFAYGGPAINGPGTTNYVSAQDALRILFDWFNSHGGTSNNALLSPTGAKIVPGYDYRYPGQLTSPSMDEISVGYGMQISTNAYAKVDLIKRDWHDFLAFRLNQNSPVITDQFGIEHDVADVVNDNDFTKRTYRGVQLQAQWNPRRFNFGLNYTWSKLRGNDEQESAVSGTVGNAPPTMYYPEYSNYAQAQPIGYLAGDQRHRARAWVAYDIPVPQVVGDINVSALQSYDSGSAYSAIGVIDPTGYSGAPDISHYVFSALGLTNYYFGERGAYRTDNITRTDFSLNYNRRLVGKLALFAQADLLNAFNRHGIISSANITTTVRTNADTSALKTFNPFTQTPIECPRTATTSQCQTVAPGSNYQLAATFGQAATKDAYQLARTYRFSFGLRF